MDNEQREARIQRILAEGLIKPKTMWGIAAEMIGRLGPRFLFWDTAYSIVFAGLTAAPVLALLALAPAEFCYSAAVAVSPALFLLILAFVETAEHFGGLYQLKQTCHYTITQITALRVLCYSLAGMLFSAGIALLSTENGTEFLSLLMLCLCSLLICASIALTGMRFLSMKWTGVLFSAIWAMGNLILPFTMGRAWERFLMELPLAVTLVLSTIGILSLLRDLSKMLTEGKPYAHA